MTEVCLPRLDWDRVETFSILDPATPFGLMRFRLVFTGGLSSGGNTGMSRVAEKWTIRKQFRPQLAELYERHPVLRDSQKVAIAKLTSNTKRVTSMELAGYDNYLRIIREPIEVEGFEFIPLVRESLNLTCSLDITFLRRQEAALISKHDIDNRIKTLLDGLTMPQAGGGIGTDLRHGAANCSAFRKPRRRRRSRVKHLAGASAPAGGS